MFVTIWMCTQEWSLISMRATALTFATCHQPLSCVVLVDAVDHRSQLAVRAHRHADAHLRAPLPRGVMRVSRSASAETGCSIRSLGLVVQLSFRPPCVDTIRRQ